jgi:hypothetical protein
VLLRRLGEDIISEKSQKKLEWIIFYHIIGKSKATATATYFGITRKTLHKYLKRFDERDLLTFEEHSRYPHKTRVWMVTLEEEKNIIVLRKNNMEFGKRKLKRLYKKEYYKEISTWKIERVIRLHKLYSNKVEHDKRVEKEKRSKAKIRIHQVRGQFEEVQEFGFLWHIDAIVIWWYGQRRIMRER